MLRSTPSMIGNYETALLAAERGHIAIPCYPGSKVPRVKWKDINPTPDDYRNWFEGTQNNIAILTAGMVVFDCDDPALESLVLEQCGETPHKIRTPRGGVHLGYRRPPGVAASNRVRVNGLALDIRTDGGLEMLPASVTAEGAYELLGELRPASELPPANVEWIVRPEPATSGLHYKGRAPLRQARNYIDCFEEATGRAESTDSVAVGYSTALSDDHQGHCRRLMVGAKCSPNRSAIVQGFQFLRPISPGFASRL